LVTDIKVFLSQGRVEKFFNSSDDAASLAKHTIKLDSIINDFTVSRSTFGIQMVFDFLLVPISSQYPLTNLLFLPISFLFQLAQTDGLLKFRYE